jgi:hypothetical protein
VKGEHVKMIIIEFLDRPPTGWFVLDVMRREARKRDWVALMIDVDRDDFVNRRPGTHATRIAFQASTRPGMPPGMHSKTWWPRGIDRQRTGDPHDG